MKNANSKIFKNILSSTSLTRRIASAAFAVGMTCASINALGATVKTAASPATFSNKAHWVGGNIPVAGDEVQLVTGTGNLTFDTTINLAGVDTNGKAGTLYRYTCYRYSPCSINFRLY